MLTTVLHHNTHVFLPSSSRETSNSLCLLTSAVIHFSSSAIQSVLKGHLDLNKISLPFSPSPLSPSTFSPLCKEKALNLIKYFRDYCGRLMDDLISLQDLNYMNAGRGDDSVA